MTSQRDRLVALLAEFGVKPLDVYTLASARFGPAETARDVILHADIGGVEGYSSFYAVFEFDDEGRFVKVGVWE